MNETDREQIDMLKRFWNEYGKAIVVAVILGLGLGYGWRYWKAYQIGQSQSASVMYFQLLAAYQKTPASDQEKQWAHQLQKKYPGTPYAALATLLVAREAVDDKNNKAAMKALIWVRKNTKVRSFQSIATLRLARLYIDQSNPKKALRVLKGFKDVHFQPMADEIEGDAFRAMKNKSQSRASYLAAQSGYQKLGIKDRLLNMKIAGGV